MNDIEDRITTINSITIDRMYIQLNKDETAIVFREDELIEIPFDVSVAYTKKELMQKREVSISNGLSSFFNYCIVRNILIKNVNVYICGYHPTVDDCDERDGKFEVENAIIVAIDDYVFDVIKKDSEERSTDGK